MIATPAANGSVRPGRCGASLAQLPDQEQQPECQFLCLVGVEDRLIFGFDVAGVSIVIQAATCTTLQAPYLAPAIAFLGYLGPPMLVSGNTRATAAG
jgi:hypothetical protein